MLRKSIFRICFSLFFAYPAQSVEEFSYSEIVVKAGYLLNIAAFLEHDIREKTICIVGDDLLGISIANIVEQENERYKTIQASKRSTSSSFNSCSVLFISSNSINELSQILYRADELNVLTVSDIEGSAQHDVMVEFVVVKNRLRFIVNLTLAQEHKIKVNNNILEYALEVYQ